MIGIYCFHIEHVDPTRDRSDFQIAWMMREKARPNFMDSGETSLSIVSLKLVGTVLGFSDRFRMRRGRRYSWGMSEIRDRFSTSQNAHNMSAVERINMNPSCTL